MLPLSHYHYKLSTGKISQVVYLDPLDLLIEASLGEELGVGENVFQARKLLVQYQKYCVRDQKKSGVTFPC